MFFKNDKINMVDQHTQICGLFFLLPIFFALSTVLKVQLAVGVQTPLIRAGVLYIHTTTCFPLHKPGRLFP